MLWRHPAVKEMHYSPGAHFRSSGQTRKFTQWMRNGVTQLPSPPFSRRTPARRRQGRGSSVGMAMSTFQKVTLATCLVLCVALLLPKMLLSRGRKDAAERPEGASPFTAPFIPVKTSSSSMCRGLSARCFSAVTVVMWCVFWCSLSITALFNRSRIYIFLPEEGATYTVTPDLLAWQELMKIIDPPVILIKN